MGKLVTLDGDPSVGKSTLALAIAAAVTTGGDWPEEVAARVSRRCSGDVRRGRVGVTPFGPGWTLPVPTPPACTAWTDA